MQTFKNIVYLRGFLCADAKVPPSDGITNDAFAVLLLATASGQWKIAANEWHPRIDWHRVICPGPFFCGFTRGMKRGDYIEVEGELRAFEQHRGLVVAGERFPIKRSTYVVHAVRIQRLDRPDARIDFSEDG